MTNQEAIKIVEDMMENFTCGEDNVFLYSYEEDALYQLIKTAKEYDKLIKGC